MKTEGWKGEGKVEGRWDDEGIKGDKLAYEKMRGKWDDGKKKGRREERGENARLRWKEERMERE